MAKNDDKRRIGREIKTFLAVNGIARETFAENTGLGKSTVDKLITGIFSEDTLAKVLERTKFRLRTLYADQKLGNYSKANWEGYISDYLMLHPALDGSDAIEAEVTSIDWDDTLPGLVLSQGSKRERRRDAIGALWIPHERSPLIYIQPTADIGVRIVVNTMIGAPIMRGLLFAVENHVANSWIPVATPIVLKRLEPDEMVKPEELGQINATHPKFISHAKELNTALDRQFGRLASGSFQDLELPPTTQ